MIAVLPVRGDCPPLGTDKVGGRASPTGSGTLPAAGASTAPRRGRPTEAGPRAARTRAEGLTRVHGYLG